MDMSSGISREAFLGAGSFLVVFTGLFVCVRLAVSFRLSGSLYLDDYAAIAAVFFLAAFFGILFELVPLYSDPQFLLKLRLISQLAVASVFMSGFVMWTAKIPILLLLIRIFGIHRWLRITAILTIVLTGLAILAGVAYNANACMPPNSDLGFTPDYLATCADANSYTGVALGSVSIATDVIIFILPVPVIAKLKLETGKKIGLLLVFLVGIGAIVGSAVALNYKVKSLSGAASDIQLAGILTILEYTIAITSSCVPAIRAFWSGFIVQSQLFSRLTSYMSKASFSIGRSSRKPTDHLNGSSEYINAYSNLEDGHSKKPTLNTASLPLDSFNTRP
ncbi:hypothetical protein INS49_004499 [Diaporthe citri]|uniref:uncharacterized protein n=1 Tax=Diaporthe citri TaxID=83186 RepID=UPI001C827748|nr:uncharacterized protein INS49_004499 [Diaporthe citri]KAG6354482.1 hypothetical protein INS49_004499 [Diaporthe citri]